jgi:hypothetical protein
MTKFTYGALALAAFSASAQAADTGWSGLDQEINNLSASLAAQDMAKPTGAKVGGYIITSLDFGDGDDLGLADDLLGFTVRNARIQVTGDAGSDYSYKVSFDLAEGTSGLEAELKDAYVDWMITEGITGRMGRYKVPFMNSALISKSKLLFLDRTRVSDLLDFRDEGFMLRGQFEMVGFYLNVMNGSDSTLSELYYNARVTLNLMGEGVGKVEGAYGAGDETNLMLAGAFGDDTGLDNGVHFGVEAVLTAGPFSIAAEFADFDDDVALTGGGPIVGLTTGTAAGTSPYSATASFLFTEMYEVGVRYEDYDDSSETTGYGLVVNRYVQGHDIKWTLQWQHQDQDSPPGASDSADVFSLGLTVGF